MFSSEDKKIGPKCYNKGVCFAWKCGQCAILKAPVLGECPFKKEKCDVTDGKSYPYNKNYVKIFG